VNGAERSSAELAGDIVHEAQDLVRLQVQLAQSELTAIVRRYAIAIGALAFAALLMLGVLVALPVFFVVVAGSRWQAGAICLGVYLLLAVVLVIGARLLLRPEPLRRTLASLEETKQWALRQIRSNGR
jgi:uncharacterized membrane protein YqjE